MHLGNGGLGVSVTGGVVVTVLDVAAVDVEDVVNVEDVEDVDSLGTSDVGTTLALASVLAGSPSVLDAAAGVATSALDETFASVEDSSVEDSSVEDSSVEDSYVEDVSPSVGEPILD